MVPNTLAKKFIVILSFIMLVAFGVTGYITYRLHLSISEMEVVEQFAGRVEQVAAKVDLRLQDAYRLSDQIVINSDIVQSMKKMNKGESLSYEEQAELGRLLNPMMLSLPNLMGLYIFDMKGQYYSPGNAMLIHDLGKLAREQVDEALQHSDGELVWVKGEFLGKETGPFSANGTGMILASRWLKDTQMNNYGVLIMVLNQSILSNDLNMVIKGEGSRVYLLDDHRLLYSDEEEHDQIDMNLLRSIDEEGIRDVGGVPFLFAQSSTEMTNFKLVSRISMKTMKEKSQLLMIVTFTSALVSILLAMILTVIASKKLLNPLKKLVLGMRRVREGNLETRVDIRTKDEFAFIGENFNTMVADVDELIKEVYIKQLREREAELTVLQAQLNPHFLYNTLDMIHSRLYLQDDKVTAGLVVSLSGMLRYALEPASSETTLVDELKQINNYLRLQQARFEQDLEVMMDVEDEVLQCGIIRLLLQPLVENVFVHAFNDHTGIKRLSIRAFHERERLIIEIKDNGCGIAPETIVSFQQKQLYNDGAKGSLGLNNVIRRIELYYGATYGLEIESASGEGTMFRLRLPYRILSREQEGGSVPT